MRPETKAVLSKRLDHMEAKHARDVALLRAAIERLAPDPAPAPPVTRTKRPAPRAHPWNRERAVTPKRPRGIQ